MSTKEGWWRQRVGLGDLLMKSHFGRDHVLSSFLQQLWLGAVAPKANTRKMKLLTRE